MTAKYFASLIFIATFVLASFCLCGWEYLKFSIENGCLLQLYIKSANFIPQIAVSDGSHASLVYIILLYIPWGVGLSLMFVEGS